jgi:hypothetical protein
MAEGLGVDLGAVAGDYDGQLEAPHGLGNRPCGQVEPLG